MIFGKLFKSKKTNREKNRIYLKSELDLRLLPSQVIYVEGEYGNTANEVIAENHDTISARLKHAECLDFIYLPVIAGQIQKQNVLFMDILNYYFPNNRRANVSSAIPTVPRTDAVSRYFFSFLPYKKKIHPGLFRYMGRDGEDLFVYEYFPFASGSKNKIANQLDFYIDTISCGPRYTLPIPVKDDAILFDIEKPSPKDFLGKKSEQLIEDIFDLPSDDDLWPEKRSIAPNYNVLKKAGKIPSKLKSLKKKETEFAYSLEMFDDLPFVTEAPCEEKQPSEEYALITRIKSDIQNLKELGFYEILLKEIGSVLYAGEKDKIFQPSRLVIDETYRIFLPDFDIMEIEMSPLPKTLFILFLRHPGGINLKSLIDYKVELLEIYKLLSYRETYFSMVESISRICNPIEGSINEKLSRIKEAFLKKMSMDTAKYYIVRGERGMEKKIEIDRSLIVFPDAFTEIKLTVISE